MSRLEFLERLPAPSYEERWLVRSEASELPYVAWIFVDEDRAWLEATARETSPWIGFAHPRVSRLCASSWLDGRLMFAVDDDRGPTLADAAAQLADTPVDRERWAVAQLIGIADGLAAMRQRDPSFVHRRLEPHRMFVDPAGHARLRAPIATVSVGERRGYLGAGRVAGEARWMSPEQAQGLALTSATDVFALAGNLAVSLTGRAPFGVEKGNELATLTAIVREPPAPIPTHADGLDRVLARAFLKDPVDRYPDPAAFAAALRACVPDASDYDAVISDQISAWWPTAPPALGENHAFGGARCRQAWEALTPGARDDVRHCGSCGQDVVRATSLAAVVPLIGKRCVAYTGGS